MCDHMPAASSVRSPSIWPDLRIAEVAHDLANTLQDTRLALAHLRAYLRQREATYATELRDQLTTIEASLATNEALLNTMIAAACPTANLPPLALRGIDSRQLVQAVVRQLRARAEDRRLTLALSLGTPALPLIACDPALLARALLNIIGNAIIYTGAARRDGSGHVLVSLDMTGPQVQITVTDNGPGIAASALAQLGQTASAPPGFGLGLAFARRVITQHPRGTFTIRSVEGSGTSVAIAIAAEGTSPACAREVGVADVRRDARQH